MSCVRCFGLLGCHSNTQPHNAFTWSISFDPYQRVQLQYSRRKSAAHITSVYVSIGHRSHVRFGSLADILRCGSDVRFAPNSGHERQPSPQSAPTACERCKSTAAQTQFGCLVFITSSWPSSSSGTKPQPPHVGHCCSSSVPFSMTPSPLQSGQVFMLAPHGMLLHRRDFIRRCFADPTVAAVSWTVPPR